jgi:3-isopropylmalate/(R)-2-methylmalate dehydratase large subunit
MGMTLTEKILAAKAGREFLQPGEFIEIEPDLGLANDITAPLAIREFRAAGGRRVRYPERVYLVPDHFTPNKDIQSAEQVKILREFAGEHRGIHFFEQGEVGVEHALLPEIGAILPDMVIIGADSHTCTYGALGAFATGVGSTDIAGFLLTGKAWLKVPPSIKVVYRGRLNPYVSGKDLILALIGEISVSGAAYRALEFSGPVIDDLSVEGRLTMANMAIEAGAKNGIFAADMTAVSFCRERSGASGVDANRPDPDASYEREVTIDADSLRPLVALPHLPENIKEAAACGQVAVDQVVIGSCTNGRIEDLRAASALLAGRKVARSVRCLIIPATPLIYRQALNEGLFEIFLDAGAVISPPTCGPCLGGYMGILAAGERCVSTTNRNFVGRMGHRESEVYLASPATAAASAVTGFITSPENLAPAPAGRTEEDKP